MYLQRWDPFRDLRRLDERMIRTRRGFGHHGAIQRWAVPLDVVQDDDNVVVQASLPGFKAEDIQVTVEESVLTIKAETKHDDEKRNGNYLVRERRTGSFSRALRLPDTLDTEKAETGYDQGVLTVTFPKIEAKKARQLEIKAA